MSSSLSPEDLVRYDRQIMLKKLGVEGQLKLLNSRVLVVGAGGLGSPVLFYLVAAGVGFIRIVDSDKVELSNLNRQILHWETDLGKWKTASAEEKLKSLNSKVEIDTVNKPLTRDNARSLVKDVDLVIDALDTVEARQILNEACVAEGKPLIHGAIEELYGQVTTVIPGETPCLRCILPLSVKRRRFPVVGAVAGVIGSIQVLEAIKLITGIGEPLKSRLLLFDAEYARFDLIKISRNPNCPVCSSLR